MDESNRGVEARLPEREERVEMKTGDARGEPATRKKSVDPGRALPLMQVRLRNWKRQCECVGSRVHGESSLCVISSRDSERAPIASVSLTAG